MREIDVAIIGAGQAGLASAAELGRTGLKPVVFERADAIAASWRGRYDRLRLNTSRWLSQLPGARYPQGTPLFPARDDVVRYLEDYAERYVSDVRLGTHVHRVDPDNGAWIVHTSAGDYRANDVVIATSLYSVPVTPRWPGQTRFRGTLIHADEYRNPEPFAGQRVLVVGAGSSGMEIAHDLAEADVESVSLSVRTPPNILLRAVRGLPGDVVAPFLLHFPPRLADKVVAAMRRVLVGDLSEYGLPEPAEGPFSRLKRDGAAPAVVDREVIEAIRARRIAVVAAVHDLDETSARLADGTQLDVQAVIAATGYRCGLEPLVGHLHVLDEHGMPKVSQGEQAPPGLHFIGFRPGPTPIRDAVREAKDLAKAIAAGARRSADRAEGARRATTSATSVAPGLD